MHVTFSLACLKAEKHAGLFIYIKKKKSKKFEFLLSLLCSRFCSLTESRQTQS